MSKKSAKIAELIEKCQGQALDAHYLGYFECFNRGLYYEAHDVLEELWLSQRSGPNYSFYKGLIQFAGAFVHMQKDTPVRPRLRPAAALLKLARTNLLKYPPHYENLCIESTLLILDEWLASLEQNNFEKNPLLSRKPPRLVLSL